MGCALKDNCLIPYIRRTLKKQNNATMATEQQDALTGVHKYKFKPPTYNRECGTFEE